MKKALIKGVCQTLVLLTAMFLIGVQIIQFMSLAEEILIADKTETVTQEQIETISEVNQDIAESQATRDQIIRRLSGSPRLSGAIYAGMFMLLVIFTIQGLFPLGACRGKARAWILINAALYLGCGIPFMLMGYSQLAVVIMNILYTVILTAESVVKLKKKHTPGRIVLRILLILLALINLMILGPLPYFVLGIIILRSVKQILVISFSQIRLDVLRKIIRKTYASEILMGMVLLIVAFSLLLSMLDPGIGSFGDALWFCFATVTTIGYGDVTSTTALGRVLSVILGIYGIVVVALITSIIVNFYNEMKSDNSGDQTQTVESLFSEEEDSGE